MPDMERTWTEVGEEVIGVELEDGSLLRRETIETAVESLDWREAKGTQTLPAMPGMAIKELIIELRIPKVSQYAISSELAPYGLYGIEGHYRNGRARVYVIDRGAILTPVASDFWAQEEEDAHANAQ